MFGSTSTGVGGHLAFLNANNVLVQHFDEVRYAENLALVDSFAPLNFRETILKDRFYASTWLLTQLAKVDNNLEDWKFRSWWQELTNRDSSFLPQVWETLRLSEQESLYVWYGETQNGQLLEVSPSVWKVHSATDAIRKHLPEPTDEWRLIQAS